MSKLLITGATGSMAPFLLHRWLHEGPSDNEFVCLVRGDEGPERVRSRIETICPACAEKVRGPLVSFLKGNLEDPIPDDGTGVVPDAVWHYAADLRMSATVADTVLETNRRATQNILDYCSETGSVLHYVSTAYVCGRSDGLVSEDDLATTGFRNAYEQSKAEAERQVGHWLRGNRGMIFRPSIVVGDSKDGVTLSFRTLYKIIWALWFLRERVLEGNPDLGEGPIDVEVELPVVSLKSQMNLVCVDYATSLMLDISRKPTAAGRTYHIVNPTPPTLEELLPTLSRLMGVRGIRLVETGRPDLDAVEERAKAIDGSLANNTGVYFPYMSDPQPSFDMSNVRELCGGLPPHPDFDDELMGTLIRYAVERNLKSVR